MSDDYARHSRLASEHWREAQKTNNPVLLDSSISHTRAALRLTPPDTLSALDHRCNLGARLAMRYACFPATRQQDDLVEAKLHLEAVLAAVPEKCLRRRSNYLLNAAASYEVIYRAGGYQGVKQKIDLLRRIIWLCGEHKSITGKFEAAKRLAWSSVECYLETRDENDITIAVALAHAENLATLVPSGQIATCQDILSSLLRLRYEKVGQFNDIDRAVVLGKQAVDHNLEDIDKWLGYTAALGFRYLARGEMDDLETAIEWSRQLRQRAKERGDFEQQMRATNNLSRFLALRFERLGALDDITEGIQLAKEAVSAARDVCTEAQRLNNLSILWARRYERSTDKAHLKEAIKRSQESLEKAPNHPELHRHLNSLGSWLAWRYDADRTNNSKDLDDALFHTKRAVDCVASESPDWPLYAGNLCRLFYWEYDRTKDNVDALDQAIFWGQKAIAALPLDMPLRIRVLWNLGEALIARYEDTKMKDDFEEGMSHLTEIKNSESFPPAYRLNAIIKVIEILKNKGDLERAMSFARKGVQLLPRASIRSLRQTDQQEILRRYAGLASEAAALALKTRATPSEALMLLEEGLGVIAAHQYNMRSDITDLQNKHPGDASKFQSLLGKLEHSEVSSLMGDGNAIMSCHAANNELDDLINRIRKYEGFERFLEPPTHDDCCRIAESYGQTIVVVNIASRCDAFIVHNGSISLTELPGSTSSSIVSLKRKWDCANENGRFGVLENMWKSIGEPILYALGHTKPYGTDETTLWPKLCWICTGPLVALPIHAAGYHNDKSGRTLLDYTISSYSVSIKAMIYAFNNRNRGTKVSDDSQPDIKKVLLVAMPMTPKKTSLIYAQPEVDAIKDLFEKNPTSLTLEALTTPNIQSILTELPKSQIFHFAGHGTPNAVDASKSSLVLADGHLTVSAIQALHLHRKSPHLAYLSACSTAANVASGLIDEGIHLMGAFQIAGFQNIIGTLWKVSDSFSLNIAREVYKGVLECNYSWQESLHLAVRKGRSGLLASGVDKEKTEKTRDGEPCLEPRKQNTAKDPLLWAAYIHMGFA